MASNQINAQPVQLPTIAMVSNQPVQLPTIAMVSNQPVQLPTIAMATNQPVQLPTIRSRDQCSYQVSNKSYHKRRQQTCITVQTGTG
jgi:hypothetical protein